MTPPGRKFIPNGAVNPATCHLLFPSPDTARPHTPRSGLLKTNDIHGAGQGAGRGPVGPPYNRLAIPALFLFTHCIFAAETLDALRALPVIPLQGEAYHVQGIDLDDTKLWLSSVDTKTKRGLLYMFRPPVRQVAAFRRNTAGGTLSPGRHQSVWRKPLGTGCRIPALEYLEHPTARSSQPGIAEGVYG